MASAPKIGLSKIAVKQDREERGQAQVFDTDRRTPSPDISLTPRNQKKRSSIFTVNRLLEDEEEKGGKRSRKRKTRRKTRTRKNRK